LNPLTLATASHIAPRIQLTDEKLKTLNESDCRLAVYFSHERISWSVLDAVHHRVVSAFDFSLEKIPSDSVAASAIQLMDEYDLGAKQYAAVNIALDTGRSLLMPQELFIGSELQTYLNYGISITEQPMKDSVRGIPAYNIYSAPDRLLDSLRGVFDRFHTVHVSSAFIENIIRENKNLNDNRLFASLSGSNLHIAAMEASKFVFYNSYPIKTKEDFAYYLMAVTEELSFHPEQINVSLSGDITPDSDYYQTAKKFLRQLSFTERPKALKYSAKLDTIPKHLFALLYSIHLCE